MSAPSRLERAAAHVSAAQIDEDTWAHYADETGRWYSVSADELAELSAYLDDPDPQVSRDAYSHWCAGTAAVEMPAGWHPDAQRDPLAAEAECARRIAALPEGVDRVAATLAWIGGAL